MRSAALALACLAAFPGCATVAVTGAVHGISYTITNVAYRTFTFPYAKVHAAAVGALKKMGIKLVKEEPRANGIRIIAKTERLNIRIDLESVTAKATKMSVDAKKNALIKDKPVAVEIITQAARVLGER